MAYCHQCGSEVSENSVICPKCGVQLKPFQNQSLSAATDTGGFGWGLLGFCVPIVGLILYLIWKDERPRTAKAAGKGALISVIFGVIFWVLYFVVIISIINNLSYYDTILVNLLK